ncbi:MAG: 5'-methylthioadenosine/S-adenosylhomocysteine nucleosidase family protein [Ktedonobacteraceae bacterium]
MHDDDMLVFTNEPLIPSKTTVTLSILSEENVISGSNTRRGTDLPQRMLLEGQITLDPGGRIFFIPLLESTSSEPLLVPDRSKWDLYLVYLPFTLHPAPGKAYYEEITFFIDLATTGARAYDLFPAGIISEVEETKTYTLSPQCTFKELGISMGRISRQIQFKGLHPIISAFGKDEHTFYWIHQGFKEQKAVFPETKHAAVILQVPRGTHLVEGNIYYNVKIVKKMVGGFRQKDGKVDTFPIHWDLQDAPPLFKVEATQSQGPVIDAAPHRQITHSSVATHFDVCLFCALAEEAQVCIREIERLCSVTFQPGISARSGPYRQTIIQNKQGEPLTIRVSWQLKAGPVEAGLHIRPVLEECTPYFAAMTGICAGDKRKVQLGDLVVASSAFAYDTGKVVIGKDGKPQLLHELDTWNASPDVLQFALMFQEWQSVVAGIARPAALRQTVRETQAPKLHIAPVASGHTVRGDNPFEEICLFVRTTAAIDMEAVTFYRTSAGFPNIRSLFAKGVSDYADGEKNDSYHDYASAISTAYMVSFIQEFVTSERSLSGRA